MACAMLTALAVSSCGGGSGGSDDAAGGADFSEHGPITYVAGKDTSGYVQDMIDVWNKKHPDEKVTFVELPTDADAQRQQMIQNAQTESDAYTVLSLDVVWNAEFAANQWIDKLPEDEFPTDNMLDPVVETSEYRDGLYSVPMAADGGLLYYRTDLMDKAGIEEPPATWQEMKEDCDLIRKKVSEAKDMNCYAGQFEKYEGLTVNFSEAVNSAGGGLVDDSGKPTADTPEAKKGLDFLADSFQDGTIPKKAVTYQEEDGRRAFQGGNLIFHRNWPYIYNLASADDGSSKVAGKFDVAPLPGLDGPGTSSLGGHNLALSSSAKNKGTAIDFMKYFTSHESAQKRLDVASLAPPYADLYDDKAMIEQSPYLPELKESILNAKARPRVVNYGEATMAIQEQAYAALSGKKDSGAALKELQKQLMKITAGQRSAG
ncbi:ABC transporter substrate-binding protein [Streptomyces sp. TR06-5]|uniref:ABC transporter substrate-binding protein n=1 Tax=unclassified Streptomyces TaxID=2593676 RepID=UPI0039A0457E